MCFIYGMIAKVCTFSRWPNKWTNCGSIILFSSISICLASYYYKISIKSFALCHQHFLKWRLISPFTARNVEYEFGKGVDIEIIQETIPSVYSDTPVLLIIKKWFDRFRKETFTLEDQPRIWTAVWDWRWCYDHFSKRKSTCHNWKDRSKTEGWQFDRISPFKKAWIRF